MWDWQICIFLIPESPLSNTINSTLLNTHSYGQKQKFIWISKPDPLAGHIALKENTVIPSYERFFCTVSLMPDLA